jgi:transposase
VVILAAFGAPRVPLYDNLKSAVERVDHPSGCAIRQHRLCWRALPAHHRYDAPGKAVARGNEKGRVERSIRYIRDTTSSPRIFTDLTTNAQARALRSPASDRPGPRTPG